MIENTNKNLQWWSTWWSVTCVQIRFTSNWIICCTFGRSCVFVIIIWRRQSLLCMTYWLKSMIVRLKISSLRTVYKSQIFNLFCRNYYTILTEMLLLELLVFLKLLSESLVDTGLRFGSAFGKKLKYFL